MIVLFIQPLPAIFPVNLSSGQSTQTAIYSTDDWFRCNVSPPLFDLWHMCFFPNMEIINGISLTGINTYFATMVSRWAL